MTEETYARELIDNQTITEAQYRLYLLAAEAVEKKGRPWIMFAKESQQIAGIALDHQFPGVVFCRLPHGRTVAFAWGELTAVYFDSDER